MYRVARVSLYRGGIDGNMRSWGVQGGPVVGGFCCVWPLYSEVHFIPNLYLTYILSLKVYFMMVYTSL